ncbi:MAG: hypothetical protein K8R87_10740 [Verrucomicrobia bacterium]|nr:hypothetical protein [Verrucomicrobiota bacterium]
MKFLLTFITTITLATAPGFGQSVILWHDDAPKPGTLLRETTQIDLVKGVFSLNVNQQKLLGSANAMVREKIIRSYVSAMEQKIEVLDSARNFRFSFGSSNGVKSEPKDTAGHLLGKKLTGKKVGTHWVFTIAGKSEPDSAEASALKQFTGYCEAVDSLGLLYGTQPRKIGETWKPDISTLKKSIPEIDADLECKLEDVKQQEGDTVARIAVTGRLTASLGKDSSVQIAINSIIQRSLRDMVDLETVINGNFRYTGQFGKSGGEAEITAPVKLTRTVKIETH